MAYAVIYRTVILQATALAYIDTYTLLGARFIQALAINILVLVLYNVLFGYVRAGRNPPSERTL